MSTIPTSDPILAHYLRGSIATVVVPTHSGIADASDRLALELEHARDAVAAIADDDAAARVVDAVQAAGHQGGATAVAVVADDGLEVWHSGMPQNQVAVAAGPLPSLGQLLARRQTWVPHAVVEVDRVGADLTIVTDRDTRTESTVDGATSHITKSNPGGWSQRRFQQRAEEHWEDNMRLVAERLAEEVEGHDIQLVLVAGGDQVTSILRDVLAPPLADRIVELDVGGRAEDGSEGRVEEAVAQAVRAEATRRNEAVRARVQDAVGSGHGVTGREAVLRALFEGVVDTIVIDLDAAEGLHAWVGPDPVHVAADASVLHQLDLDATRVPLADAALRGAAATGATVLVVHRGADDRPVGSLAEETAEASAPKDQTTTMPDGLAASLRS